MAAASDGGSVAALAVAALAVAALDSGTPVPKHHERVLMAAASTACCRDVSKTGIIVVPKQVL